MTPADHIRALLRILTKIGGYLEPEDQAAIAAAREAVQDTKPVKTWTDRGTNGAP